jgi:chromate transporter
MGTDPGRLTELVRLFLKLGLIGFGGPAAHIAMMEEEVVGRRRWLTREHFLDLVGATNLIPGPNSTEMAIHIGYLRCGWVGLLIAGLSFIIPAVLITAGLAWAYVQYGTLPQVAPFLFGIKPALIAVIFAAVWRLGRTAAKNTSLLGLGCAVAAASLLGFNEIAVLVLGGVIGMLWLGRAAGLACLPAAAATGIGAASAATVATAGGGTAVTVSLVKLGLFFLKVGAVLYGSGYVLVAFLEGGLVRDYGWLSEAQLMDAIAIGQLTPGPVLSTATFIGYVLAGLPGAAAATAGIFLPSFIFVAALSLLLPRLRRSRWMAAFLDAVNISSVALMAAVTVKLSLSTLTSWPAWVIALAAAGAGLRWKVNATWLVLGGAVIGRALSGRA